SSLQYGTFVPFSTTSGPLTSARLAVFSVPSQVQVFQFTNKGVMKQLEAGDPNKRRTSPSSRTLRAEISSFCKCQEDQVPREGPALGMSSMSLQLPTGSAAPARRRNPPSPFGRPAGDKLILTCCSRNCIASARTRIEALGGRNRVLHRQRWKSRMVKRYAAPW